MHGKITIQSQKDCDYASDFIKKHFDIDIELKVKALSPQFGSRQTIIGKVNGITIDFEQSYLMFSFRLTEKNTMFDLCKNTDAFEEDWKERRVSFRSEGVVVHL
jgi:hypothetical protein